VYMSLRLHFSGQAAAEAEKAKWDKQQDGAAVRAREASLGDVAAIEDSMTQRQLQPSAEGRGKG